MNLLILVVALFAIMAYFMFSLGEVMKGNQAGLMVNRYTKDISTLLTSATYCDRVVMNLPPHIAVLGQATFYYTLKVSMADSDDDPLNGNFLIFGVRSKTDPDYLLATATVRSMAMPHLFFRNEAGKFVEVSENNLAEGIELDPQAYPPWNAFAVIKKVIKGKQHVFIIPCNPTPLGGLVCDSEISQVFEVIKGQYKWQEEGEFRC